MSFTKNNLPRSYQPYEKLTVCSNTLIGGSHIAAVGEVLPLIIGTGEKPQIWLQAINNVENTEFISIVENSVSKHPAVDVIELSGVVTVKIQGKIVLSVMSSSESSAVVSSMDLRPIGLNMFGDIHALKVGSSSFSGNTMSGGGALIGLGS
ncbi:hypothetical protein [Vreelandella sedimenti]|uniref:hypothetical protein n=1 Tax=Vreelandella sedimenti TaxID=2729618 RepID=UPI002580C7E8|nr:hypothetical protein [Halomonas sp. UBA3173]|tara:strand:+ start:55635 stop:56087 length:453 start_codon:yes stop_codon:yes gene_type:complete